MLLPEALVKELGFQRDVLAKNGSCDLKACIGGACGPTGLIRSNNKMCRPQMKARQMCKQRASVEQTLDGIVARYASITLMALMDRFCRRANFIMPPKYYLRAQALLRLRSATISDLAACLDWMLTSSGITASRQQTCQPAIMCGSTQKLHERVQVPDRGTCESACPESHTEVLIW